jgi:hypothetical protein
MMQMFTLAKTPGAQRKTNTMLLFFEITSRFNFAPSAPLREIESVVVDVRLQTGY